MQNNDQLHGEKGGRLISPPGAAGKGGGKNATTHA